jgi:hypothetical protein
MCFKILAALTRSADKHLPFLVNCQKYLTHCKGFVNQNFAILPQQKFSTYLPRVTNTLQLFQYLKGIIHDVNKISTAASNNKQAFNHSTINFPTIGKLHTPH